MHAWTYQSGHLELLNGSFRYIIHLYISPWWKHTKYSNTKTQIVFLLVAFLFFAFLELQKTAALNMGVSCSDPRTNNIKWRMFANLEQQNCRIITLFLCRSSYKSLIPATSHHQFQLEATLLHQNFSYFEKLLLLNDQNKTSFKYNQQDATLYNILYYCQCSTCCRRFLRPSSGAQNCTHSIGYMPSLLAATASGNSKQAWHIPDAMYTVLSTWWWAENPPETCRSLTLIKNIV